MEVFFQEIFDSFYTLFNQIIAAFANLRIFDLFDIVIVAFIIYKGIELFRETRAKQLIKGIGVLFVVWVFAQWFELKTIKWLLVKVIDYALIAIAIIFQPELRSALERMGRSKLSSWGFGQSSEDGFEIRCIDAVCKAAGSLQDQKVGALIVFERFTRLGEIINTGTIIDAKASPDLICNVFYPKSPLHDGAMVIRNGRISAAGCILPLSSNSELSKELGTRHRAAIGMSENSDALVVVVSEETGNISVALNGSITRGFNSIKLKSHLNSLLIENENESAPKGLFNILKRKSGKSESTPK
ncbi:MAG: diadenylate cyclase CdaA [Oscillospiraceae bacterium]|nr:diadenylate cyclase CdaA [Oscillospiraceae bacterium]